jgi:ABC-2 type transport system permease protein
VANGAGPIADLTYRNYDGPLGSPAYRWWVIAAMGLRNSLKNKWFWWLTAMAAGYYFILGAILFVFNRFAETSPESPAAEGLKALLARLVWKDQFLHGLSFAQIWFLMAALLVGAGAIANDNRANALLVYLSKPCDRLDYILGKWVGIFLPLLIMTAIPTLAFLLYGALSFRPHGFLTGDPWLPVKVLALIPIPAITHASLILGFSSLFNHGRLAGAAYAGLFFLSNFFTQLMVITWAVSRGNAPGIVQTLYYASIDGIQIAMFKGILVTDGSPYLGIPSGPVQQVPGLPFLPVLAAFLALNALFVFIAWSRVRAVEVVG